jgi:hypothetical protein
VWLFVIASNEGGLSHDNQEAIYFIALNFIGILIFGGVTAWLGKLFGLLTLAAFSFSAYSETIELLVLTPVLALLNVTSPVAQWTIATVVTASSFFGRPLKDFSQTSDPFQTFWGILCGTF